jgi:hypothetical protein
MYDFGLSFSAVFGELLCSRNLRYVVVMRKKKTGLSKQRSLASKTRLNKLFIFFRYSSEAKNEDICVWSCGTSHNFVLD